MTIVQDLIARNRAGEAVGLPCFCTANEHVLRAVLAYAKKTGHPTVIEATCNQVNQDGGYTGMTASDFMAWLSGMAADAGVPMEQLILGGDHIGPNVWKNDPLDIAMEKSRELIKSYVQAGFKKIHIDTSMACGGEPHPTFEQIAERAADLCAVAEEYAPDPSELFYIIGTEVPIPGGETEEPDTLDVTSVERYRATIETHYAAFMARDLRDAWSRIVSIVTQPGVDFGHTSIYPFVPEKAGPLSKAILKDEGLTFEAHSTDYQSTKALADLVKHHFFFLKVGPELTFRFREAVWALSSIQDQISGDTATGLRATIQNQMNSNPRYWKDYYSGTEAAIDVLKIYSYSDRIRYYWTDTKIATALEDMINALQETPAPETMLSQAFMGLEFGDLHTDPTDLIHRHIQRCVERYFQAAGFKVG